jgi:hypothetical protein
VCFGTTNYFERLTKRRDDDIRELGELYIYIYINLLDLIICFVSYTLILRCENIFYS